MRGIVLAVIALLISLIGGLFAIRANKPQQSQRPDNGAKKRFLSIVFLLKQPRKINRIEFERACERAFKKRPETDEILEVSRPGKFILRRGGTGLGLLLLDAPYTEDPAASAERISLFRLKEIMQQHKAWLSVDLVGDLPEGGIDQAYQWMGKLAAELLADDCIGIYSVESEKLNVISPDTASILRGQNPQDAFEYNEPHARIEVSKEDSEILAATLEARRRWPEFTAAFAKKRPMQGFAVKAPLPTDSGSSEHIWIEVDGIGSNTISGKLANDPMELAGKKIGDPVTIPIKDIEDWIYQNGKEMAGGFSAKVLRSRGAR